MTGAKQFRAARSDFDTRIKRDHFPLFYGSKRTKHVTSVPSIRSFHIGWLLFGTGEWQWESIDASVRVPLPPPSVSDLISRYDLCVTGEGLSKLTSESRLLNALLPHVRVFARVSPKQKVCSISFQSFNFFFTICAHHKLDHLCCRWSAGVCHNQPERSGLRYPHVWRRDQ